MLAVLLSLIVAYNLQLSTSATVIGILVTWVMFHFFRGLRLRIGLIIFTIIYMLLPMFLPIHGLVPGIVYISIYIAYVAHYIPYTLCHLGHKRRRFKKVY